MATFTLHVAIQEVKVSRNLQVVKKMILSASTAGIKKVQEYYL